MTIRRKVIDSGNPAAAAAFAKGDVENALVAATPGGIEAQEARGQASLTRTFKQLPKDGLCSIEVSPMISLLIDIPDSLGVRLNALAVATGDQRDSIVLDALALHLDELDGEGRELDRAPAEEA